ncbi:MAG: serine/threonine protein kinase [Myxococcales bacterium]|nr:serine/threonine protein kinase [Myxococcales bacterium]
MANEATSGQGSTVERLGRYELLGEIASGGMATVYLGRVTGAKGFQRLVAIKRLHPHLEGEEEFVSMFLDEARLAAKIRHPNVVGTLDVEDDEHLYLVMEYVEGDRLLALLRHSAKTGEKIPPAVAVRISMDTLAGLHAAHELTDDDGSPLGLVHRDVSPQNILISVDGSVKLVDFGIAKASARLSVTRDGQLKGKIAYMAPEQTKRSEIDRRVDVFAMGIITWEMLTAKKLFNGESDVEVLNQLLFEPIPRLREVAPTVPASLDSVVSRALERDPAKRFSTAAEFADALERASKIFGGPATTKTIAAHLQKVSGEKIAKDRARILAGAPPVPNDGATPSGVKRRATGQFSVPTLTNPGAPIPPAPPPGTAAPPPVRKATMVGLGGNVPPPPPARPSAPTFDAGPSLLDDDEDVPTAAIVRADVTKSLAAVMAPTKPVAPPSAIVAGEDLIDDEPTAFEPAVGGPEPTSTARDAVSPGGGASLLAPTANPRAMTQQLPAVRPPGAAPVPASTFAPAPLPAPTAGVSIETPFEVPAPRVEQPKSKAGLIVGAAALFLLMGGGGAVAFVKFGRPADATISTPRAVTANNGASDNGAVNPANVANVGGAGTQANPAGTPPGTPTNNGAAQDPNGAAANPANAAGAANPTAGTAPTITGTQNTAAGAANNGAPANGVGTAPGTAAGTTAGATAGTAAGAPPTPNTGTQNGTPSAPTNGAAAQGATNTGTQNGSAANANTTGATATNPPTPSNGTRPSGGRRTGGRRTGGRNGGSQGGGGEDLFGGTPY